ncbi:MAG: methionine--tRNA ligase [Conexivisphaerales archaeon]
MGKWIVFSAWPYINSEPHLGTLLHLITADYYTRFLKSMGEEAISVSGSDEHGTPIEVEAMKQGRTPVDLTNEMHKRILGLLKQFSIELDNYSQTESMVHKEFVRNFYLRLDHEGYVFKQQTVQLYCEYDKIFLPDRFVVGKCPFCGYDKARGDQCENCGRLLEPTMLIDPKCVLCGNTPIKKQTYHWFFDLPKLTEKLRVFVSGLSENVKFYSLNMINEGLKPRSITRDNKWGISSPFPGSEGKTIYVWMEAILGYLSGVKELELNGRSGLFEKYWKSPDTKSVYFIGKDNIPFHSIILPGLLVASNDGYNLPKYISSTEFFLFEQLKFSKSQHVGVWANEALQIADGEYWRYALLSLRPERGDSNFSWIDFQKIVNNDLNDTIGNFVNRVLKFVSEKFDGIVPEQRQSTNDDDKFISKIISKKKEYIDLNYSLKIKDAVRAFLESGYIGNEYLSNQEPWNLIKDNYNRACTVIYNSVQVVNHLGFMMSHIMPIKSANLLAQLDLEKFSAELTWEAVKPGHRINKNKVSPLFSKIKIEKV